MADDDGPKHRDQDSEMRKQANRMTSLGQQLSAPLHAIRDELFSLRELVSNNKKIEETRTSEYHKASLEASRRATRWSRWLTIVNLVLTGLMLWVLYSQLLTTRVDQRAWIIAIHVDRLPSISTLPTSSGATSRGFQRGRSWLSTLRSACSLRHASMAEDVSPARSRS